MARKRTFRLERVLTDNAMFSTAYGNVGSSIYYALGLVAGLALGMTPIVFVIAGFIFFLTAATYTEASTMYPEAGGSSSFARHAFGEAASFGTAWAQLMNFIVTAAISALFVPHYLGFAWEWLGEPPGDIIVGALVIVILCAVNIRGAREAAGLNLVMAVTDLATQLFLVLAGIFLVLNFDTLLDNVDLWVAPSFEDFLLAIPVAMIAYTGIETVSNMSEEAIDAPRSVPRAMRKIVLAVVAIYAFLPAISLSALPVEETSGGEHVTLLGEPEDDGGYAGDPVLGVVNNMDLGFAQDAVEVYVGLLAATILILAANAGIFGVSRLVYSMGSYQQLPARVSRLHNRFRTPYVALAGAGVVACILLLGPATFLGNLYAAFAMASFTVAHIAVIALRRRYPDAERPYRGPWNVKLDAGWVVPVFAVIGAAGTSIAFVAALGLHPEVGLVGIAWMGLGALGYVGFRRRKGLGLDTTTRIPVPEPVTETEVSYHSTLVVCDPAEDPREALFVARRLADQPRHVDFLSLVPVPSGYPFDHPLPREEKVSRQNMQHARRMLGPRAEVSEMRCPRDAKADAIIRQAVLLRAEAIVMPMPPVQRRISRDNLFGGTRLALLDERPCRILLVESATTRAAFDRESVGELVELPVGEVRSPATDAAAAEDEGGAGRLMVSVFGGALDDDVMQTACLLASPGGGMPATVHAVGVVDVAHEIGVESADPGELAKMTAALLRAEAVGREYEGVEVVPHLYAAHHVGLATVRISEDLDPEMLLLAADDAAEEERDADAETLVGRVTQTVMRYAHCRVVLTAAAHSELVGRLPERRRRRGQQGPELHQGDPPGFG